MLRRQRLNVRSAVVFWAGPNFHPRIIRSVLESLWINFGDYIRGPSIFVSSCKFLCYLFIKTSNLRLFLYMPGIRS